MPKSKHRRKKPKGHKLNSIVSNLNHLPPELTANIDIKSDIIDEMRIDPKEVVKSWATHRYPTIQSKQTCKDVITNETDNGLDIREDIYFSAKLALLAYAQPYTMMRAVTKINLKNHNFSKYLESFVSESTFLAYEHMEQIVDDKITKIPLVETTEMAGFYIRTPIRIWNQEKKRVYTIPPWEKRQDLLKYLVVGDCNCYVMRHNFIETNEHDCYVMFRGTSNEFNGLHQYGNQMLNTQIYRMPDYDPIESRFYYPSETRPLFYYYYAIIIDDLYQHILSALEKLSAKECRRIVVTGHSLGSALTLLFCYVLKIRRPDIWDKCYFRSFASPMSCNDAAVKQLEQWFIDADQPNKYVEVINDDDFVNIQYLLGGDEALKEATRKGSNEVGNWLLNYYLNTHPSAKANHVPRYMKILQLKPEIAASAFLHGAVKSQIKNVSVEKKASHRLGQRKDEMPYLGTKQLKNIYNRTLRVFYCERHFQWDLEYLGKSHSVYMDLNFHVLWAPLRLFEDHLYKYYAKNGLKKSNNLYIIPMFPEHDLLRIRVNAKSETPPILKHLNFKYFTNPPQHSKPEIA